MPTIPRAQPDAIQLIRRAHRRRLIWRAIEFAGIGAAAGGGGAIALQIACAIRGLDAIHPTVIPLFAGVIGGVIASITRGVPTLLQTAAQIDEQIKSADLFASAMSIQETNAYSKMAAIVIGQADAAASRIRLNDLMLQRLGSRAWGGIGLGVVCVLLATLLQPASVTASGGRPESVASLLDVNASGSNDSSDLRGSSSTSTNEARYDSSDNPTDAATLTSSTDRASARVARKNTETTETAGSGATSAETRERGEVAEPGGAISSLPQHQIRDAGSDANHRTLAGPADAAGRGGAPSADGVVTASDSAINSTIASSASSPAARRTVSYDQASNAGSGTPAEYRDLIRAYFDRAR